MCTVYFYRRMFEVGEALVLREFDGVYLDLCLVLVPNRALSVTLIHSHVVQFLCERWGVGSDVDVVKRTPVLLPAITYRISPRSKIRDRMNTHHRKPYYLF